MGKKFDLDQIQVSVPPFGTTKALQVKPLAEDLRTGKVLWC